MPGRDATCLGSHSRTAPRGGWEPSAKGPTGVRPRWRRFDRSGLLPALALHAASRLDSRLREMTGLCGAVSVRTTGSAD